MAESVAPAPVGKEVREHATSKVDAPVGQPTGAPPAPHPIAGNGAATALPKTPLPALTIAAIGVVYGDIGTSPLYTMREAFGGDDALPVTEASVFGVLSLIFWSLFVVVTLKYVIVILRADNRGEGASWRSPRWRCATYRRADAAPCWCWPCSVRRCSTAMG